MTDNQGVREILDEVKRQLASPQDWCSGHFRKGYAKCLYAALLEAEHHLKASPYDTCTAYSRLISLLPDKMIVSQWNDAKGRTHADVLTLLQKAIDLP